MEVIIDLWNEEKHTYEPFIGYSDIKEYDIKCFTRGISKNLRVIEMFGVNNTYEFNLLGYEIDMIRLDNFMGEETLKINISPKKIRKWDSND